MSVIIRRSVVSPSSKAYEHGYGMVLVAPLSESSADRVLTIANSIESRLGAKLWTPHTDITLGRLLNRGVGKTEKYWAERFQYVLPLAAQALRDTVTEVGPIATAFDAVEVSTQAISAYATRFSKPIANLRMQSMSALSYIEECELSQKHTGYVHTTLGRYTVEGLPIDDVERVAHEVTTVEGDAFPFIELSDRLVIAEERARYELIPREIIALCA